MYTNDELACILLKAISTHPSLDHKIHLMDELEKVFNKLDKYEDLALEHHYQAILDVIEE